MSDRQQLLANANECARITTGERTMSHTALPWHTGNGHAAILVYDGNGNAICDAKVFHGKHSEGEAEANAEFICRAANCHDDLLAACEALPLDVEFEDAADFKDNAGLFLRAMNLAKSAIAKAKPG